MLRQVSTNPVVCSFCWKLLVFSVDRGQAHDLPPTSILYVLRAAAASYSVGQGDSIVSIAVTGSLALCVCVSVCVCVLCPQVTREL